MLVRWLCLLLLAVLSVPATAATAWVSDEIYVPVRSGAGSGYRIVHRGLKSGTQVEFLGEEGDWAHIRHGDVDGYIGKQYISRTPVAAIRLRDATQKAEKLEQQVSTLREQLGQAQSERDRLSGENQELQGSLTSRGQELDKLRDVAADPLRLDQANRRLNEELSMLRSDLDQLKAENAMLRNDNTSRKWITGVAILILGAVAGLLLKSRSGRRRGGWAN
ncbi:TIGR04211 family SH3 domain-containing protein [Alloalcanivorax gelatiniphagus]|uniref:TIGR04211 family SH3 domain-containing protein n=1 Tax=Alloalcanivorax gelatiniphagus TaxID=1194167 RepID=A0ABY2XNE7_9GAMM|nr:TIGR04211 family SH3 domain-containing protein [Alloalcanivorax gelatiniphagus]TMW13495.1 TIGR04211 family SH3 domain-containing protein [Alloalcanivorax gelatiniphagus]|tara:strand:- start:32239 stop:32898 length:660 start_codon:yes stop_codon:yes gene_type:complete